MIIKKLSESFLVEDEIVGQNPQSIKLSPEEIKEATKNFDKAYDKASSDSGDAEQLYVVKVVYKPTKKHIDTAQTLGGTIMGVNEGSSIEGYLQENPNSEEKIKSKDSLINLGGAGDKLLSIVDEADKSNILRQGYFNILAEPKGATAYILSDAEALIKKLQGIGSGVTKAQIEKVRRENLGLVGSKKEAIINLFLTKRFTPTQLIKMQSFKDLVAKIVRELGFENNPVIEFLRAYLKRGKMSRGEFIALNNLYAKGIVTDKDFIDSDITPLLMKDLLVGRTSSQVEAEIDRIRGKTRSTKLKVTGDIPVSLSSEDEEKFKKLLQDYKISRKDVPSLVAYLKKERYID